MYKRETHGLIKHLDFVILDLICLQLAYIIAFVIFGLKETNNPYGLEIYRNMALLIELVSLVVLLGSNTLSGVLKRGYFEEFLQTVKQALATFVISVFLFFLVKGIEQYSRLVLGFTFVFYFGFSYIVRTLWKEILRNKAAEAGDKSLLIIANKSNAEEVICDVQQKNYAGYRISGVVIIDADMMGERIASVPVVARIEETPMYVCQTWVDEVLIAPQRGFDYPEAIIEQIMETGVTVHVELSNMQNSAGKKQIVEKIADRTVITTTMNYASPVQLFAKRVLDIIGGIIGCILTGIIFIIIGPIIYINSPGPIFFAQERIGKNGKKFKLYKFRSMYMDAEERKAELMAQNKVSDAKMFKMDFDPRVIGNKILPDGTKKTGIGQFIRDTSLDEFPQFWCVLRGTMSLCGTRPPLESEVNLYELHHKTRLAVKPGITGNWQVSGRSDITDFEEVVRLDQEYIRNWTIGLDIKIILKTVMVVLKREGSV